MLMRKLLLRMSMSCLMLMVAVMANAAPVTASWDFRNDLPAGIQANTNYQGVETDIESTVEGVFMHVDATNGKLYCVGRDNAQFNAGTILRVPVSSNKDEVTVEGYPGYSKYHFGNETEVKENTASHIATNAEVKQGYVEIISDGGFIYCVSVVLNKPLAPAEDITGTWDYADKNVMAATVALSGSSDEGTVNAIENNGLVLTVAPNGAAFRNNGDNIQVRQGAVFKVPVKSTDDVVTVYGYPNYSYYTIGSSTEEITNTGTNPSTSYSPKNGEVQQGYVAITSTNNNNYFYKITVVQKAQQEKPVLENESATATFPFNLGTEGQTADFGEAADYFIASKVTYGEGLQLLDKNNGSGFDETRFMPYNQNNSPDETNVINFTIQPKHGLVFTPTEVAFKATRFGTDNGLLDVAWLNPDGSTVSLATEVKPNRNSGTNPAIAEENGMKYSDLSYTVTGATPAEGACGLQINLYHLQNGKQIGFADIVIKGVLNGQEVEVPILNQFSANGIVYVADDVFEADGDAFTATIELSKKAPMISASNPLTDVSAITGEIGEITYEGDDTRCDATIPVILGDIVINYVAHFVQKPDFTLTYINTDGSEMGTQIVEKDAAIGEFAVDYTTAIAPEGYKVRGWFQKKFYGVKYQVSDVVTSDLTLYAVATEIEGPSPFRKYNFDLTNVNFYPEDHEAFESTGSGCWHDVQHGWVFNNGDRITLLVGEKANIMVTNCKYSKAEAQLVFRNEQGEEVGRIPGVSEGDGEISGFMYQGAAGKLFLDIESTGAVYIHSIRIVNTSETNYASQGNWYFVKPGDATSLIDVIDYVNGVNASRDAERSYIFLPNGTYDMGEAVLTAISGNNISLIGQSAEGTIVKNAPDFHEEGIGKTATFVNSSQNLYMQDLTLKNEMDYYAAQAAGLEGGRAVCLQDRGDRAIFKNVTMLSYQDTYYSQNTKQSYWENCDIHGTVDFLCGGGDVRFQNTTISLEPRNSNGTGGRTICAPTTSTGFGYVFDNCRVVDLANGKGDWNFGRTWQNEPIAVYLNTTLDANAEKTLVKSRWTQKGMNNKDPKLFGEFGTMNEAGENITPASNVIASHGGEFQTILTAEQAAEFTYDKMFKDNANAWDPASLTVQAEAPVASYADGALSWTPVQDAIAYAVFKNDVFVGLADAATTTCPVEIGAGDVLSVRAANAMGGLGEPAVVKGISIVLDENAENEIPAAGTPVSEVKTKRTLVGGAWNTICLPFAISADEMASEEHPFHNAQVMELMGAEFDEAACHQELTFLPVAEMEAGFPYVIKVDEDVVDPTFCDVTIGQQEPYWVTVGNCTMTGLYSPYEFAEADKSIFFLAPGNKFTYVAEPGIMKGMRAYFTLSGIPEAMLATVPVTIGTVDGIISVTSENSDGRIYDLQGRRLNKVPAQGVYIKNGHKYVK